MQEKLGTIKYNNHGRTQRAKNLQYKAENPLDHNFRADKPNEKWLVDVTEIKQNEGIEVHKVSPDSLIYGERIVTNQERVLKLLDGLSNDQLLKIDLILRSIIPPEE